MEITFVQEDYLRAIYLLQLKAQGAIKKVDLVAKMKLSKSTITQRLAEMREKGLIDFDSYGPVILTAQGLEIAKKLTYKHRIIEQFLSETLGFEQGAVHEQAHLLEHAFSDEAIERLASFLGNPTHCPHGRKLPNIK
jgi:DtxR family Mn-dependent transcriptional regulator